MVNIVPFDSAAVRATKPGFSALIAELQHATDSVFAPKVLDERPFYGTALHLATCPLDTRHGPFRAHIF
jgi:hypothetical protein